jgi:hypothetical protein
MSPYFYFGEHFIECPYCNDRVIKRLSVDYAVFDPKCICTFCTNCHKEYYIVLDPAKCLLCNRCNLYLKIVL